jgi:hypothetical protein
MQPTNKPLTRRSRCMYCGSPNRGKGCADGPHVVHFHQDSTGCSYCGSPNYGRGCKVNPEGDLHMRGSVFNNMYRESLQSYLDNEILLKELKKDFSEFECHTLGIIDEKGNKIKAPVTEQEQVAYSPMVRTILRLKRFLGPKTDLLEATSLLEKQTKNFEDIAKYKRFLEYQDKVDDVIEDLYKILNEATQEGFKLEDIKKLIKA